MRTLAARAGLLWRRWEDVWLGPGDARVAALVRIAFATVALLNLLDLWPHRAAFFSDAGLIDAETARERARVPSILFALGSPAAVTAVMGAAALAMACLALGILPRLMVALVFAWQLSYTARAGLVIHGWDILLRAQAFVLLISPLGPSLAALWRGGMAASAAMVPRHGLLLLQIQLAVVYWQTVWLKAGDAAWRGGEYVSYYMLSLYSRFPGEEWAGRELLSSLLTHGTLAVELAVPLLLWNRNTRLLGLAAGLGLHFSILAMSQVWIFSLTMVPLYLAFLQGEDLDRLTRRRGRGQGSG